MPCIHKYYTQPSFFLYSFFKENFFRKLKKESCGGGGAEEGSEQQPTRRSFRLFVLKAGTFMRRRGSSPSDIGLPFLVTFDNRDYLKNFASLANAIYKILFSREELRILREHQFPYLAYPPAFLGAWNVKTNTKQHIDWVDANSSHDDSTTSNYTIIVCAGRRAAWAQPPTRKLFSQSSDPRFFPAGSSTISLIAQARRCSSRARQPRAINKQISSRLIPHTCASYQLVSIKILKSYC